MRRFRSLFVLSTAIAGVLGVALEANAQNLIDSIVKGGITAAGDVAGAPTDFLINLNVPMDDSLGLSLLAGNTFKIILPPDFIDDGTLSTVTAFSTKDCTPGALDCNTSAFIQGWPQRPIVGAVPPVTVGSENTTGAPVYTLAYELGADGSHVFTHTAVVDVVPGSAPPGPGIKQVHMILPGFTNPSAGDYEIQVIAQTGPGGAEQTGSAQLSIRPAIAPSLNLNAIYDPMRRNTVFQEIAIGDDVLPYEFWLWDDAGAPYLDVEIIGNDLVQGNDVVGQVTITGPDGASGQALASLGPSVLASEPFFGRETARLSAQLTPGDLLGNYTTTVEFFGGNSQSMVVRVVPEPSSILLAIPLAGIAAWAARRRCRSDLTVD